MNPTRSLTHLQLHLQLLDAEATHIFHEVVAERENPAMLYPVGKGSATARPPTASCAGWSSAASSTAPRRRDVRPGPLSA